jgi:PAS domain S-box-containing protein
MASPSDHPTFDEAGLGLAYAELTGRYVRVNRQLCDLLGYEEDELLARTFFDVVHADDPGVDPESVAQLLAGDTSWFRLLKCYARKDGSPLWARLTVSLRRDERGAPLHYVNVVEDISEQVAAERQRDELLAREARARDEAEALTLLVSASASAGGVQQTIDAALLAVPRLMRVVACNVALPGEDGRLRFTSGLPSQPIVGHLYDFLPGEGLVGRAYASGELQHSDDLRGDARSHRPDLDAQTPIRAYLAAPLIANGRSLGVITAASADPGGFSEHEAGMLTRIAGHVAIALEAEQARQALRAEVAQKSAIIDNMIDAVLVVDRAGRIVLANAAAAAALGEPLETLVGLAPDQYPWGRAEVEGEPAAPRRFILAAIDGEVSRADLRLRRRDGTTCWIEVGATRLLDAAGEAVGAVFVGRDTTARRAAEAEAALARSRVQQSEKVRAVGQMASGIAHNLNQSLALIASYAELAESAATAEAHDPEALRVSLGVISRAARDGGETVKRLLTFVRGRSDDGVAEPVAVDALLREVAELTAPRWREAAQAEGRPITLAMEVPSRLAVLGREADLREALTNLVFNAVDAMPEGGRITLAARASGGTVEIDVTDTGIGIDPEVLSRVFEPFFSTKGERGTGLGLAMVFTIAERHGGSVDIRSELGRGTTFTMKLPAAERAEERVPANSRRRSAVRPLRVLIVDDQPQLRMAVETLLRRDGHAVRSAASAEAALGLLAEESVDVVLSDLAMGAAMNGWELAASVRAQWPTVRFVLCTGMGAAIDAAEARARGVDRVLPKPFQNADLRRVLEEQERSGAESALG